MAIINTLLTNGINLDPIDAVGGIQQLWICASFSQTAITLGVTASRIDSLTGSGTFFQFDIPKDTSSFTEEINFSFLVQNKPLPLHVTNAQLAYVSKTIALISILMIECLTN